MRNKLLAAVALCAATSSTMPLWAAQWDAPTLTFMTPALDVTDTQGEYVYVYHVASGKFMCNGNATQNWGTELVVAEQGKKIKLIYGYGRGGNDDRSGVKDPDYTSKTGWKMQMPDAPTNGGFHDLFIPDQGTMICVDHNIQGHMLWQILPNENGTYKIKIIDDDVQYGKNNTAGTAAYANTAIGVDITATTKWGVEPTVDLDGANVDNYGVEWKFVSQDVHDAYVAKKSLQKALNAADEAGYTDVEAYGKIYNDPAALPEAVENATTELNEKLADYKWAVASETNPVDVTDVVMTNADFNTKSFSGWINNTGAIQSGDGEHILNTTDENIKVHYFAEKWVSTAGELPSWDVKQNLKNLRRGKYRVTANVWATRQGNAEVVPSGFYLFAEADGVTTKATADIPAAMDPVVIPFASVEFEVKSLAATVGFMYDADEGACNWTATDNFKIEYLGDGGFTVDGSLKDIIKNAEGYKADIDEINTVYSIAGGKKFDQTIKAANDLLNATEATDDEKETMIKTVSGAIDTLKIDVTAYETLKKYTGEAWTAYEDSEIYLDGLALAGYEKYLEDLDDAYDGKTFDPSHADSLQINGDSIYNAEIVKAFQEGRYTNANIFVENPNFDNGSTGWKGTSLGFGASDYEKSQKCAELYQGNLNKTFDVYQEVTGLPEGTYEVSMQGFYRPTNNDPWSKAWGVEGDKTNDVLAYFYANDSKKTMCHIAEGASDTPMGIKDGETEATAEKNTDHLFTDTTLPEMLLNKYVPNAPSGAVAAFALGKYHNKVKCYIREGETLRFGIKCDQSTNMQGSWMLFDNLRLEYLPGDRTGIVETMNSRIEELAAIETAMPTAEIQNTLAAEDAITKAKAEGDRVLAAIETIDMKEITAFYAQADAAVSLYNSDLADVTALKTLAANHQAKSESYAEDYSEETVMVLLDVVTTATTAVTKGTLKDSADVAAQVVEINKAYGLMLTSGVDYSGATKDTPIEIDGMIQNPTFEVFDQSTGGYVSSYEGWTVTKKSGNHAANSNVFEFFNAVEPNISQDIYGAVPGWYRIDFKGFYREGDAIPAAISYRDGVDTLDAKVYVQIGDKRYDESLPSIFEGMRDDKYVSADIVLPDSIFGNTQFEYNCIVNDMAGVEKAFADEKYKDYLYFYLPAGVEKITLGVDKKRHITNDWMIFDDFKITYYGDGAENQPDGVQNAVADAQVVEVKWTNIAGQALSKPQRGLMIRTEVLSDGTTRSTKVMVK